MGKRKLLGLVYILSGSAACFASQNNLTTDLAGDLSALPLSGSDDMDMNSAIESLNDNSDGSSSDNSEHDSSPKSTLRQRIVAPLSLDEVADNEVSVINVDINPSPSKHIQGFKFDFSSPIALPVSPQNDSVAAEDSSEESPLLEKHSKDQSASNTADGSKSDSDQPDADHHDSAPEDDSTSLRYDRRPSDDRDANRLETQQQRQQEEHKEQTDGGGQKELTPEEQQAFEEAKRRLMEIAAGQEVWTEQKVRTLLNVVGKSNLTYVSENVSLRMSADGQGLAVNFVPNRMLFAELQRRQINEGENEPATDRTSIRKICSNAGKVAMYFTVPIFMSVITNLGVTMILSKIYGRY